MIEKLVKLMTEKPYLMDMGAGNLARRYHTTRDIIYEAKRIVRTNRVSIPKILLLDIETSPLKAYVWKRWKENISLDQTLSEWFMLSWSAKWLFDVNTYSMVLTPKEVLEENDLRIVRGLWDLLNEADIIIAHNGDKFDIPKINSRFILNGLLPTKPYQTIDTLAVAKKQFGFSSNKLDALAGYFGIDHKIGTDFKLWANCMAGDDKSLKYMETYNKKDVEILEEVYLVLRPWIKNHPNVGTYIDSDTPICTHCGSTHLHKLDGFYHTQVAKYEIFRCECGAISRGRHSVLNKEKVKVNTLQRTTNNFF